MGMPDIPDGKGGGGEDAEEETNSDGIIGLYTGDTTPLAEEGEEGGVEEEVEGEGVEGEEPACMPSKV